MAEGKSDPVAQLIAAIDRLAAATLAAALLKPESTSKQVEDTYRNVLREHIQEGREMNALFSQIERLVAEREKATKPE